MLAYQCNICGQQQQAEEQLLDRELPSCSHCGSNVRFRSIIHLLSLELFGESLILPKMPRVKDLRGLGMSDWTGYAGPLADRFDYTNTFYDREPRFDITYVAPEHYGCYDFVIASEVFEHVTPPVERAFTEACKLLHPHGVLFLTVPYTLQAKTVEHYPGLARFTLAELDGSMVLVNRRKDGALEVFDDLVFHGGSGSTLEMRVFGETDLRRLLETAGFRNIEILTANVPEFGIVLHEKWSLPIVARKEPFRYSKTSVRRLAGELMSASAALSEGRERSEALEKRIEELQHELEQRTRWAQRLDTEIAEARANIVQLQQESREQMEWAQRMETELRACERLAEERRQQALTLESLRRQVQAATASRWLSLGRLFGVGPKFNLD